MKKSIAYFVNEIRTPFVINDLRRVSEKFETIFLFSVNKLERKEALPKNVVVFEDFINWQNFKPGRILFQNLFTLIGIYFKECLELKRILPPARAFAVLASNIYKAECVMGKLNAECSMLNANPSTYYSFWFYDCIFLAWMKKKNKIERAVSRAHSGDLYETHGSIKNKILFRNFQFTYLDILMPVSKMGVDYLNSKYPKAKTNITPAFLGTVDPQNINPHTNNNFVIVSCASLRHHKRIHKIAEALLQIDIPITWIHFGDEKLNSGDPSIEEYKKNKALLQEKNNVTYMPMGFTSNEKIFDYYKSNPVHLFVSLSAIEGVPVSIMEAISFGIPVLSTDVGGCKEIVTESTGILIPLETNSEEVAKKITEFRDSSLNTQEFRMGVRRFWEENFEVEKNYNDFFNTINSSN